MTILGIETSCDETAAAVVCDGRLVRSNCIFSQVALHRPYGGVVPEIASRSHIEQLPAILADALKTAGVAWGEIDAVAATYGPGLATSLLVGFSAAKGLAQRLGKPLVAVNHIEAHIYSVFLGETAPRPEDVCPFTALVASGGHTCLVRVERLGCYRLLGQTIDDAAGEAFDKGANLLALGYPGGPAIDKASSGASVDFVNFPRGRQRRDRGVAPGLDPDLCFSFSGLKTALLYYLREHPLSAARSEVPALAASYQEAVVDALLDRSERAMDGGKCLAVAGGVSLNTRLRKRLGEFAASSGVRVLLADRAYCADNAAMIAGAAGAGLGVRDNAALRVDIEPSLELPTET